MGDLMKVGADFGGAGSLKPFTAGISGAQRVADAHARYMQAVLEGRVFQLPFVAAAPAAYVGAAAGTPLAAAYNPVGSNKYFVALAVTFANRVAASAAGTAGLALWSGPCTTAPAGTRTNPTNALTLQQSGSAAQGYVNTALTSQAPALGLAAALHSYYWATAAGAFAAPSWFDLAGLAVVVPGCMMALGVTAALTSATYDGSIFWEEVPALIQG